MTIEHLIEQVSKSNDNTDMDVLTHYSIDDLDKSSIDDFRRRVEGNPKFEHYEKLSSAEFLEEVGVIAINRNTGTKGVTIGGLLFLGKHLAILQTFPHFQMDLFDRRSQERWRTRISTFTDHLNVYQFFILSYNYLKSVPDNGFIVDEYPLQVEVDELLKLILREALLNLIMHTDYFSPEHEMINISWHDFEFINAGMMKIPVENFFTTEESKAGNVMIARLLKLIGFGECAGTGGEEIFNAAKISKIQLPSIETDAKRTILRISNKKS